MTHKFADTMFTKDVKAAQKAYGSLEHNEKLQNKFGPNDELSAKEINFISERDSFYIATVNETGWPYVQHRGGPAGFLRVLGPKQLAYADFRGNTQLVSVGNLTGNDRSSLILMDYANRQRLKILGKLRVENAYTIPDEKLSLIKQPEYKAEIERVFFIDLVAFDWNCPQHITRRYSEKEFMKKRSR